MPAHPANSPFSVEVADAHPEVDVKRNRSRSNAVMHTTMLFRSSTNSSSRVRAEGAERVRIAVTGSEATAFGNPTFGERTSITITHRDVNHALRTSLYERDTRRPVRFVTVAPIPEDEVPPPPETPGVDLSLRRVMQDVDYQAVENASLVPPDTLEVMAEWVEKRERERIADQVKELLKEKEASRSSPLKISTTPSIPFPCTSASPTHSEFPERPSAPGPMSPFSDEDDDFPLGTRPNGPVLAPYESFGASSAAESLPRPPVLSNKTKNGSTSSLPQTDSPVMSLTKTLKLKLTSPKSRSTSDLNLEYTDGVPLSRDTSNLKVRLPVVKRLFGLGKGKSTASPPSTPLRKKVPVESILPSPAATPKVKGQKRQRDDEEGENIAPAPEKENRIVAGRNIRRKLVA